MKGPKVRPPLTLQMALQETRRKLYAVRKTLKEDSIGVATNKIHEILDELQVPRVEDVEGPLFDPRLVSRSSISTEERADFISKSRQRIFFDRDTGGRVVFYQREDGHILIDAIRLPR